MEGRKEAATSRTCKSDSKMASNKTNCSLNLQPMNSGNYTAAIAGVTSSDTDEHTVFGRNADGGGADGVGAEGGDGGAEKEAAGKQYLRGGQAGNRVLAEEDMIPPYDSSMCTNNSLINDSSVLLASSSLDLKPQKKKGAQETPAEHHAADADVVVAPPLLGSTDNGDHRSSDRTESLKSTVSAESRGTEETERTSGTSATNNTHATNDLNEETRQLSDSSSGASERRGQASSQYRKDTLTDNTLVEKQFDTMNLRDAGARTQKSEQVEDGSSESQSQPEIPAPPQDQPQRPGPLQPIQEGVQSTEQGLQGKQQQPRTQQGVYSDDCKQQRQAYEQSLEQKKMEQFRRLNMQEKSESRGFAKSVSPMSPKTTAPFAQKLPAAAKSGAPLPVIPSKFSKPVVESSNASLSSTKLTGSKTSSTPITAASHATSKPGTNTGCNSHPPDTKLINSQTNNPHGGGNSISYSNLFMSSNLGNDNSNGTFNVSPQAAFSPPKRTQSPFRDLSNPYLKQINNQQRPLYTPAVLRVMKNFGTSPSSEVGFDVHQLPSERPPLSQSSSAISVRSTASSIVDYWNYMTGRTPSKSYEGPTREHWKPDSSRFNCAQCGKLFNYMTESRRKHHCRSCGDVFCGDCLKNYIYLDRSAHFTLFGSNWDEHEAEQKPNGLVNLVDENVGKPNNTPKVAVEDDKKYLCKVCLNCFQQYEEYVLDHTTRDHNLGADGKDMRKNNEHRETTMDTKNIPVDWNWSSF